MTLEEKYHQGDGHTEWRESLFGHRFGVWVETLPRIVDNVLKCVVFLYKSKEDASNGKPGGTGFMVGTPSGVEKYSHVFIVTARHVVDQSGCYIPALNDINGVRDVFETTREEWFYCPDGSDLAILPLRGYHQETHSLVSVDESDFEDGSDVLGVPVGVGDDVFMIGRQIGREGKIGITPIARFGSISQLPGDPVPFIGQPNQTGYITEMRSRNGFSGSPVFVYFNEMGRMRLHSVDQVSRIIEVQENWSLSPRLLGVNIGSLLEPFRIKNEDGKYTGETVEIESNLAIVLPISKVKEMMSDKKFDEFKKEDDEETRKIVAGKEGYATPDFLLEEGLQQTSKGKFVPIPEKSSFLDDLGKASTNQAESSEP